MFDGEGLEHYLKTNLATDALTIYSLKGNIEVPKEVLAEDILNNGLKLNKESKLNEVLNPKGLIEDIRSLSSTITKKFSYFDKDICNVVISTPQVISSNSESYYIGYPRDNVSGYTTASHQKDYACCLTDYLERINGIYSQMVLGYYYEDGNGKKYFKGNKNHYSNLDQEAKLDFFDKLLEKMDNKINISSNKDELLKYIKDSIEDNNYDNNSKYQTALEYIEYQNTKLDDTSLTREEFIDYVTKYYQDYALYLHGVDQSPKTSREVVNFILRSTLHIDEEYGFSGTCEPKGPINELESLDNELNYYYGDNKEESYNMILLTPKVMEDMNYDTYFLGYSRKNNTGTFPKSMTDFNCILSDIINEKGYIPREFVFAYHVYGPNLEDKFYLNPNHISFLSEDLQRIFVTKFLNTKNLKLKEKIKVFSLNNLNEDLITAYANPIVSERIKPSMETTALEYFDYIDKSKDKAKLKQIEHEY